MSRKKVVALIAAAGIIAGLTGCTPKSEAGEEPKPKAEATESAPLLSLAASVKEEKAAISEADTKRMVPTITPKLDDPDIVIRAVGMGVIPENSLSQAQAIAMGKRAAIADGYRQIGEKVYGIRINATDTVKDMMMKNTTVRTEVNAIVRNATIDETVCKDGLCQVSMEIRIDRNIWKQFALSY